MASKWDEFSVIQKRVTMLAALIAGLIAIGGSLWAGVSIVATDAEVDAKVAEVQKNFDEYAASQETLAKQKDIREANWRLEDIEYRLLDPLLPAIQRAALQQSKTKLLRRIQCIQAVQAFCE